MKKIVTISVIFALLVCLAVWEIIYSSRVFDDIYGRLIEVEQSIELSEDKVDLPLIIEQVDGVIELWTKAREVMFCLGNHNTLRNVDEKLFSLQAMVATNHKDDASVTIKVCIKLIDAIKNDTHPVMSNLF